MIAAGRGAREIVSTLLEYGGNPTETDFDGKTALHYAAVQPKVGTFKLLIDSGCDPYRLDGSKHSSVYYALSQPQLDTYVYACCMDITHLLHHQVAGQFPVSIARQTRSLRFFLRYTPEAVKLIWMNGSITHRSPALVSYAIKNRIISMDACIRAGADVEATRDDGDTALLAHAVLDDYLRLHILSGREQS